LTANKGGRLFKMDLEQVVQRVLVTRRDLTREEVLKRIYDKKRSAEDYLLDDVAARIVAAELGVEVASQEEELFNSEITINSIVSGLNNVTLTARVITVSPVQAFFKRDLTEGKVARLLLADKTGTLRLVLWNDKIGLVEKGEVKQGNIVRVSHGYVREGLDGKLELHMGQKGNVEIQPSGVVESDYPQVDSFLEKIGGLTQKSRNANVLGVVHDVYSVSEFKRKDGTNGKVRRLRLSDETGEIFTVFWNGRVDELGEVQQGMQLRIMNAKVRTQPDGRIELHVENATQVEKLLGQTIPQTLTVGEVTRKIAELKEEGGPFTVEATVASAPEVREVTTFQQEKVLLASFDVEDDTDRIRVTLWRKQAEQARTLQAGTRIKLANIYAKKGFSNLLELTSRNPTTIETLS
jgi:replication factor A1